MDEMSGKQSAHGENKKCKQILVQNFKVKKPFGIIILKVDHKDTGCKDVSWIKLPPDADFCEYGVEQA